MLFPLSDALLRVKSGEAAAEGVATKSVESSGFLLSPVLSAATGMCCVDFAKKCLNSFFFLLSKVFLLKINLVLKTIPKLLGNNT